MSTSAERPIPRLSLVSDYAPMTAPCQRCGARDHTWITTVIDGSTPPGYFQARLCRLCVTGALQEAEQLAPYTQPVTVALTLQEA